jgi:hypothetical protein
MLCPSAQPTQSTEQSDNGLFSGHLSSAGATMNKQNSHKKTRAEGTLVDTEPEH